MSRFSFLKPSSVVGKFLLLGLLSALVYSFYSGHFEATKNFLDQDQFTFKVGAQKLSLYDLFSGFLLVLTSFWITAVVSNFFQNRILRITSIRNSNRILLSKIVQAVLYFIVFLIVLRIMGIDLAALSIFGGAVGIGLGLGLQKTASNFFSGLILLTEKTIEIGDLLELNDGTLGFVKKLSGRYTLIETFESREIIVPNEDLTTSRVVNHTLTSSAGRVDVAVGVSYGADILKAHDLILEAATEHPLTIQSPEPNCYLTEFGDSSVNFLLHFWVSDVRRGRLQPKSEVMFEIWKKFKENNIEIPFPQRDLHLKGLSGEFKNLSKQI